MPQQRSLIVYIDFKSPYAYLAKDPVYDLQRQFGVAVDWRPYILDIPSYLGSARLDDQGRVIEAARNPHQWRRVRYVYMDCRRQARKRGLVIRGTQKIWDSTLAAAGMLFAKRQGDPILRAYMDITFERFWKRELDIENSAVIAALLQEAGADTTGAEPYLTDEGRAEVAQISQQAEEAGIFGTPSFVLEGELFWGNEHLSDISALLALG